MQSSNGHVVRALTIAGSDSGGGAGIQADLKTMHQFGVYGMSVVTALTAQNTVGVQAIQEIEAKFVREQLHSVLDDIGADAVKTGMLANESIILEVSNTVREYDLKQVIVDPVMVAKGGQPLITRTSMDAMRAYLLPIATVLTPNLPEASALCGYSLNTWAEYHQAAKDLASCGAQTVILKGGHAQANALHDAPWIREFSQPVAVDIVFHNEQYTYFVSPRVNSTKTHGTGCTFSAAIAAMMAKGTPLLDAIAAAKAFIFAAIDRAKDWDVGAGHGPTDHSVNVTEVGSFQPSGVYLFDAQTWSRLA